LFIFVYIKTNKMKIDKIYYWNETAQRYLPCVWSEDFECYLPDLKTKI